jgi:hypothetical protein
MKFTCWSSPKVSRTQILQLTVVCIRLNHALSALSWRIDSGRAQGKTAAAVHLACSYSFNNIPFFVLSHSVTTIFSSPYTERLFYKDCICETLSSSQHILMHQGIDLHTCLDPSRRHQLFEIPWDRYIEVCCLQAPEVSAVVSGWYIPRPVMIPMSILSRVFVSSLLH